MTHNGSAEIGLFRGRGFGPAIMIFLSAWSPLPNARAAIAPTPATVNPEVQLTFNPANHDLDNNDNFSPDDQWLVYDTRPSPDNIAACARIEKVHLQTGQRAAVYEVNRPTPFGPGVGAASFHPLRDEVIFLRGLTHCSPERPYALWRRTGVMVEASAHEPPVLMDARDVTSPFTPGALRGGTHRHEWSADGQWIGFTYNDALMAALEETSGQPLNLRTIGVATRIHPVAVHHDDAGENNDGAWFSALVVKVVPHPEPGSDQISRAFSDAWIGARGYRRRDGTWQRARAFLGNVRTKDNQELTEVFLVDIPERIDRPGSEGPLQGTPSTMPMPPAGARQRRLTHTSNRRYPGVATEPRHWVRSSPDGTRISFLARDDDGIVQVFFVSPAGGAPRQVTRHPSPLQSTVRWSPDGRQICYVCDGSLFVCGAAPGPEFGQAERLTPKNDRPPLSPVWSHDGRTIAFNRRVRDATGDWLQIFLLHPPPPPKHDH